MTDEMTDDTTTDRDGERGASLVEFALIAPLLILLIFGIVDFGWLFANHQDVRHGAREAARLAIVDYSDATDPSDGAQPDECAETETPPLGDTNNATRTAQIVCAAEGRMGSLDDDRTSVQIVCHDVETDTDVGCDNAGIDVGDVVKVRVCFPMESLSGVMTPFLSGNDLSSTVEMRLEQVPTFAANWDGSAGCP